MLAYPVKLTKDDNGTVLVSFPDVPEAVTFGEDKAEALARGVDALETALQSYISDKRAIPKPNPGRKGPRVAVSLLSELKLSIWAAMMERGLRKVDLARLLDISATQADRILDLRHGTSVDLIEQSLKALDQHLEIKRKQSA